jgi:site-specific DNA recombinase
MLMRERPRSKTVRCAIYTRKSSEEGLEQDFNSLQAQREACEAFITSQKHEGWKALPTAYDDGGYSGGSMDRPALQMLLSAIKAGSVDVVVVYKVDRLTRALADFAKMVEVFDQAGVSFVSVTQQFNTTTSMGRLTLNVLLSFAQFEREVTGERIRDKFSASKRKGLWMGGYVPFGYRPNGRTLVIHEGEAEIVRTIFGLYAEHRSVATVEAELRQRGISRPPSTTMTTNRAYADRPFSRGEIYKLLANPVYVGEIGHKGKVYPGQHPGIVDRDTWATVRAQLAANTHARYVRLDAQDPSLLAGLLFDNQGNRLTPTHANKQGKRYRYYAVQRTKEASQARGRPKDAERRWRISAAEIERVVIDKLRHALLDRHWVLERCVPPASTIEQQNTVIANACGVAERLAAACGGELREVLVSIIGRVMLADKEVRIDVSATGLRVRLTPPKTDAPDTQPTNQLDLATNQPEEMADHASEAFSITVPVALRRRGVETKLILEPTDGASPLNPDSTLIKLIAQAHQWREDILAGRFSTMRSLAKAYGKDERHVARLIPLAFLAPTIVDAIIAGSQPADLLAQDLLMLRDVPANWNAQRAMLGFI